MGFDFPASPNVGDRYPASPIAGLPTYAWDGEKWTTAASVGYASSLPWGLNPWMDGAPLPGNSTNYSRGDHVHPTDNTLAPIANPTFTGTMGIAALSIAGNAAANTLNVTGNAQLNTATANTATFGALSATSTLAVNGLSTIGHIDASAVSIPVAWGSIELGTNSVAQTPFIDFHSSGINHDYDARIIASGGSASVDGAGGLTLGAAIVTGPAPPPGDNSQRIATTAWVNANAPTGSYFPLAGGTVSGNVNVNGDIYTTQGAGAGAGVCYLGNTGSYYINFDGSNYVMPNAPLIVGNGRLWGTNDFGSAPCSQMRLVYVADQWVQNIAGMTESYSGAVLTGGTGINYYLAAGGLYGMYLRYRQVQLYTTGWFAIGYA